MTTDNLPARRDDAGTTVDLTHPLADLRQALELADTLARSQLVPNALLGKPASVFHILMIGQSLDLHWTEALRVIYCPGPGQVGMRGSFLLARLRKAGHRYTITEEPDACVFKLTRGDTNEEFSARFTIEDAIKGGLVKRDDNGDIVQLSRDGKPMPWMAWTKRMLRWRAVSDCVSFAAPEVALGFEIEGAEPAPQVQQVELTPGAPAPPDSGEAAPADQAAQAAKLAEINREMATGGGDSTFDAGTATPVQAAGGAPGNPEMGGNPDMGGNPPSGSEPDTDRRSALIRGLATQFSEIGWDPAKFRPDVLRAMSMFARRRIMRVQDLKNTELARLSVQLTALQAKHSAEHQVVALADQVDAWRENWSSADAEGLDRYERPV